MCGIAGIWLNQSAELKEATLERFNNAMHHRGPDGSGLRVFNQQLGLAHRRLSILDTSESGAQPMADSTGRYHITFNGEVFNFIEIREELESKGERFESESDTEVILAAYRCWGMDAFHRFNGMWAIAIWDQEEEELLLCRDRYGIKPLYYLKDEYQFAFASETNAFKHLDGYQRSFNAKHVAIGLEDTYALEGNGHTLFDHIYQLLPGHFIRMRQGDTIQQKRWYSIADADQSIPHSYEEQVEKYSDLFQESCALRMRSDVSLATALSGGVDSTAVYSTVHKLMQESKATRVPEDWQRAFVAVFPGTVQDERVYAEQAIAHTGGKAVFIDPTTDALLQDIQRTTVDFDAISSTPILALMSVYQGMRSNGVTVSLDGHGVDEMLYGYRKMVYDAFEYHKWHGLEQDARVTAEVLTGLYAENLRSEKQAAFSQSITQAFAQRKGFKAKVKNLFKGASVEQPIARAADQLQVLSDKPYDFNAINPLDRSVYQEFFIETLPSLLRNFDKASMMSSIEIRMPFMDYRMVEYAFGLPLSAKLGGGYTKRVLRDAMKGIMPEANRARTFKVGLAAPTMEWFQGPLSEWVGDMVHSRAFEQSSHWDKSRVQRIQTHAQHKDWTVPAAADAWKYINAQMIIDG